MKKEHQEPLQFQDAAKPDQLAGMILRECSQTGEPFPFPVLLPASQLASQEMGGLEFVDDKQHRDISTSLLEAYSSGDAQACDVLTAAGSFIGALIDIVVKEGESKVAREVKIREVMAQIEQSPELDQTLREYISRFSEWLKLPETEKRKKHQAPRALPQPTFYEARTGATAISDGRDLRDWNPIEGMMAMLHAPKDSIMQTRFEPCSLLLGWWGKPAGAELETLQCELQKLEFDALVTYFVCLSWAVEEYQVTASLDSIIEAIGRGTDARRSTKARQALRAKVWRWMLLFDSLAVIGARRGTWREPRDGDKKRAKMDADKLYSRDALLKIIGTRATEQGTFDNSAPPKEVTFVAGPWVNQFRGNREILSDFGNVRAIASIPRGKPSGAWAACIGFALNQKWREQAATAPVTRTTRGTKKIATQKFRPFTRRVLLAQLWRSEVNPEEILKGTNPERAKEYWEAAVVILKKDGIIGIYKEIEPLAEGRQDWQDAWLDQPLDIRPAGDSRRDAIEIHQSAETARKRGRKKTPPKTD
jgi:hypothetical protein